MMMFITILKLGVYVVLCLTVYLLSADNESAWMQIYWQKATNRQLPPLKVARLHRA